MTGSASPLIAVDVGNTRIKLGLFAPAEADGAPVCREFAAVPRSGAPPWALLHRWAGGATLPTVIGGSHPAIIEQWERDWAIQRWPAPEVIRRRSSIPVEVDVDVPDRVGLDRLLNAVAARFYRPADQPAIIVDAGTAVTVDYVSRDGRFCGGAILPGLSLGARALHSYTALLPLLGPEELRGESPAALGRNTQAAMKSGLRWGLSGAVRELIAKISAEKGSEGPPCLFLTGGDGSLLTETFPEARCFPSLAMHGLVFCVRNGHGGIVAA